jgi:hypothetical protein
LILLLFLALLPRLTGLLTFHTYDENPSAAGRILTGELASGTGVTLPLINYLNAASYLLLYAIGRLIGVWHDTADFRASFFTDRTPFIFAIRLVAVTLGALAAPLAALIASRLDLSRRSALIVGVMIGLMPVHLWLSHIAKPDSGVALGVLFLAWAILRKLDAPEAKGGDVIVGIALAIAVSFKQTAVFMAVPALAGLGALLRWDLGHPWSRIVRGFLAVLAACTVIWVPLNVGILADIRGFLDYQRIIAMVQTRSAPAYQVAKHVLTIIAGNVSGLTVAGFVAWLFAPWVRHDRKFLLLWGASALGFVAIPAISGTTTQVRYLLPFATLALTLGCIATLSLCERRGLSQVAGISLVIAIVACESAGTIEVIRQAMALPMRKRCGEIIKAIAGPERDKILAAAPYLVGVPISAAADDEERARYERLAKKYGVELPERAREKLYRRDTMTGGYFVLGIPFTHGGTEDLPLESHRELIKPALGIWPLQKEEWDLNYWTARGFTIFVVRDERSALDPAGQIPLYRALHLQIKKRCELVSVLPALRPLFGETELRIYRIRDRGGSAAYPAPN